MAAFQQAFVVPAGTNWSMRVSGTVVAGPFWLKFEAMSAARTWLLGHGGGELVVRGEDGQTR